MTRHNATWSDKQYRHDEDSEIDEEEADPRSDEHGKRGYWDYRDD